MRAFTRIAATTVLATGVTVSGAGAAFADPPEEVTEPVDGVADTVQDPSPEAAALLEDPQVQEILADEEAVELLSDPEALELLRGLLEFEDPMGALEELDPPVSTDDVPVEGDGVTGGLPVDGADTGDVTQPVDDVAGGVGLP
ncbi:hypothetical protein GCM10007079_38500 [Nocardiopsis terrae]|uniref:Secreted protein n=1 Tax=Nocardiopsis terrae TaxID=372655 RepID=A0ABR9HDY1_9ACTN|nr:hypothetical protein [Nocardiopsis terrae]MBE1457236.1 hypothetical protein [Nocardiopsis terrae]GHC91306.1 hypothetical protein GCM10007079_38500 [Nocardiopsis terrae]